MFMSADWVKIADLAARILFISIPEETFIVMFCLILLKQFDFLGSKNEGERKIRFKDIFDVAVPVIVVAFFSNILRQFHTNDNVILLISFLLFFLSVTIVYKLWSIDSVLKCLLCTIISIMVLTLIEFLYVSILFYATKKGVQYFDKSTLLCFVWVLPERVLEYSLLGCLILKKISFLKGDFFRFIMCSKALLSSLIGFVLFNMIIFAVIGKLIWFDKILQNESYPMQVIAIVSVLLFPVINIIAFIWTTYHMADREHQERYFAKECLKSLTEDLYTYVKSNNFDKVEFILQDIKSNVDDLYEEYSERK